MVNKSHLGKKWTFALSQYKKLLNHHLKNLLVMVTDMVQKRDGIHYKVYSKNRHLSGTYSRSDLEYQENYTKEIVKSDQLNNGFTKKLP